MARKDRKPDIEIFVDSPEREGSPDPEAGKVDTERGLGEQRHIENSATQAVQVDDVSVDSQGSKQIPSVHPTEQLFLTGDIRADASNITQSKRGYVRAQTFLGLGSSTPPEAPQTLPTSLDEVRAMVSVSQPPPKPKQETYAQKHAKVALLRTLNFYDYLILKSPPSARDSLELRKAGLVLPRHLPEDDEIKKYEQYTQSFGWYCPVLWLIPPRITLEDLAAADLLSEDWWATDPDFIKGITTRAPFELPPQGMRKDLTPEEVLLLDPSYWVLAVPCLTPGTTGRIFDKDNHDMSSFVRMSGFDTEGGKIHPRHRMAMKVLHVSDVAVFYAMAQQSGELISRIPLIARTATMIKSHEKEVRDAKSGKLECVPAESMYFRNRACVEFAPGQKLRIIDWQDSAGSQVVGIPFFAMPYIYN
jgi:hypothetical protein